MMTMESKRMASKPLGPKSLSLFAKELMLDASGWSMLGQKTPSFVYEHKGIQRGPEGRELGRLKHQNEENDVRD